MLIVHDNDKKKIMTKKTEKNLVLLEKNVLSLQKINYSLKL